MTLCAFDMDGTILDSMTELTIAATDTIEQFYTVPLDKAKSMYEATVGFPFAQQLDILFPKDVRNVAATNHYERLHKQLCPYFKLAPGVPDLMLTLLEREHRLALVTSTDESFLKVLPQVTSLPFHFIGGFRVDRPKAVQLHMAKQYAGADRTILFGDSNSDYDCAKIVGAEFCRVDCVDLAEMAYRVVLGVQV